MCTNFIRRVGVLTLCSGLTAVSQIADAGVGYYYEAPSDYYAPPVYSYAPPVYSSGFSTFPRYGYGGYAGPRYYGAVSPNVGTLGGYSFGAERYRGYSPYGGYSTYGRYGVGRVSPYSAPYGPVYGGTFR